MTASQAALLRECDDALRNAACDMSRRKAFFVPGRIEVLGKHTDYAGGRSLLCALERGIVVAVAPRRDGDIRIHDARGALSYTACSGSSAPHWATYADAAVRRVRSNFPDARTGADIAFAGDLPLDSGMSSSSALIIALFLAIDAVNDIAASAAYTQVIASQTDLAAYLATVENGQSFGALRGDMGVGVFGGSEDHTAILCCREDTLSEYSFAPVRHERDIALPDSLTFVVAYSGVAAPKSAAARDRYNELSVGVSTILELWNAHADTPAQSLAAAVASSQSAPDDIRKLIRARRRLAERFEQFVNESARIIPAAANALAAGDYRTFGELVDESQRAAETQLRNQVPETIALARSARGLGALAASAFGAGFGGSVWALVAREKAGDFLQTWQSSYNATFPEAAARSEFFTSRPGPAAHRIA